MKYKNRGVSLLFRSDYSIEIDINEIKEKIKTYLYSKDNIICSYLFGSFDTDDFNCDSDIDIAVIFNEDVKYSEILKLNSDLEDIIGRPIDLNNLENLPEYIQVQVIMRNYELFSKDDVLQDKYINKLNHWIKTEYPFWRKLVSSN